jgi:hypothetical protein
VLALDLVLNLGGNLGVFYGERGVQINRHTSILCHLPGLAGT